MAWRPANTSYDNLSTSYSFGQYGGGSELPTNANYYSNWRSVQQPSSSYSYYSSPTPENRQEEYNPVFPGYSSNATSQPTYGQIDPSTGGYRKPTYSQEFYQANPQRHSANSRISSQRSIPRSTPRTYPQKSRAQARGNSLKVVSQSSPVLPKVVDSTKPLQRPKAPTAMSKQPATETLKSPLKGGVDKSGSLRKRKGGKNKNGRPFRKFKPKYDGSDLPINPLDETMPVISLTVNMDNMLLFHGFQSIFTTQHKFPIMIDNKIYESVDHYYQVQKLTDLCGSVPADLLALIRDMDGRFALENVTKVKKGMSQIAKEALIAQKIDLKTVDKWRMEGGLAAVQKALMAKASQSAHFREALKESGQKIIVHAYAQDRVYGSGCHMSGIQRWCDNEATVKPYKIPFVYPLDSESIAMCPVIGHGRNLLGVILMQLRKMLVDGMIKCVDMSTTFENIRLSDAFDMDTTESGFAIGSASFSGKK